MFDEQSVLAQVTDAANRLFAAQVEDGGRAAQALLDKGEWPARVWAEVEAAGFDRLLADDMDGEGWACAAAVFESAGYHALSVPLMETALARGLLRRAGVDDGATPGPITVAQLGPRHLPFERVGKQLVLEAKDLEAGWARHVKHIAVAGQLGGKDVLGLFALDAGAASIQPHPNLAGEPRDRVTAKALTSLAWGELPKAVSLPCWAALATSCAMVGAARRVLDLSLLYANDRVQFGRNIGKFQVLQHALAMLSCEVAAATMATRVACEAAESGAAELEAAVAKVRAGQAAGVAASVGHQVHGAIGFTEEHTLHHFTRRLWSWRREWGAEREWAIALGRAVARARGAGTWPLIVELSSATDSSLDLT